MPIRTAALLVCFVAALVLARSLGYKTLASLLPFCFLGGMSAWTLWKHYRWGEPQKAVKQHKFLIAMSMIAVFVLFYIDDILDLIEGKYD
ncbi:hypothetical protein GCM10009416_42040 [Craurococcus roseus]|uniref:Uncharacterized protein n=1 Tax=Craurococcus roseus TaxID=77585 RepID=A0ABP3R3C4_9PROT